VKSPKKEPIEHPELPSAKVLAAAVDAFRAKKVEYKAIKQGVRVAKKAVKTARKAHRRSLEKLEKSDRPKSKKAESRGAKSTRTAKKK